MTTTVPASMLAEIQGWAPGGGFVHSEYHMAGRYTFTPGELFRHPAGWAVITSVGTATSRNAAGDVLDVSPAVSWLDQYGNTGSWVLWITHVGLDVRTDTRIDPATFPPVICVQCDENLTRDDAGIWRDPDGCDACPGLDGSHPHQTVFYRRPVCNCGTVPHPRGVPATCAHANEG